MKFVIHLHYIWLCHLGKKDVAFDGDMDKTMSFYERLKMVQQIVQDQREKGKDKYRYRTGSSRQVNVDFLREEFKETNSSKSNGSSLER